jgi:hypothetical protein
MAEVVDKHKALDSNRSTTKKKENCNIYNKLNSLPNLTHSTSLIQYGCPQVNSRNYLIFENTGINLSHLAEEHLLNDVHSQVPNFT